MRRKGCACARAHIEVKTAVTALQARVYRENKRYKSVTDPLQTVTDPLQIDRLRRRGCAMAAEGAGLFGGCLILEQGKKQYWSGH